MSVLSLNQLIEKLDSKEHVSLEKATALCVSKNHHAVELEHWLAILMQDEKGLFRLLLSNYAVNQSRLIADVQQALSRLRVTRKRAPSISQDIINLLEGASLLASLEENEQQVHGGYLLLALLESKELSALAQAVSYEFAKIPVDNLKENLSQFVAKIKAESNFVIGPAAENSCSGDTALSRYTIDLTEQARQGEIDPIVGRDDEIRQIIDVLVRRRQNNPILTGEAGVGKTAVVEGLAMRIAQGQIPGCLKDVSLLSLDLALLQAGAGVKGEFEERLKTLIQEVKSSNKPIVLFIDEAHTLIGAGGAEGQGDAANLLKPALARGELRTIAATTWSEYKKYIEKDPALTRRFQIVKIEEPDEEKAVAMMQAASAHLEKHHGVRILREGIVAAVQLSMRYLADRQLPDKSLSLLDTACARVALSQHATPAAIEQNEECLQQIDNEMKGLVREQLTDKSLHKKRLIDLKHKKTEMQQSLEQLKQDYEQQKQWVKAILTIKEQLENDPLEKKERTGLYKRLKKIESLRQAQQAMIYPCVDAALIAQVVTDWTGVPVGNLLKDEVSAVLDIQSDLNKRVKGQDHALKTMAETIRISRAHLNDPNKPIGVFMLAGTSGTGKTETALALAELLYGSDKNLTVINMSEFKEEHKVSLLLGSPPGYVGFGEGGVLTNAVRRKPYSIILLDEMEKAHPGVQDIFYQVFDKGMILDGEGREVDFKNTIIIMTTNAGSDTIQQVFDSGEACSSQRLSQAIQPELLSIFKPAFLGRCHTIPYLPLSEEVIDSIVQLKLNKVVKRIKAHYQTEAVISEQVINCMVERTCNSLSGARAIDQLINNELLPKIATVCLEANALNRKIKKIEIDVSEAGMFTCI